MTSDEQLQEWLKGNSIHNDTRNECCPDFSCCKPELLASEDERNQFVEAHKKGDGSTTDKILAMFLVRLIENEGLKTETSEDVVIHARREVH